MTFTFENVDIDIRQDKLPSTSPHVLEKIIDAEVETQQDNVNGGNIESHQQSSIDVTTLEQSAQVQSRSIET